MSTQIGKKGKEVDGSVKSKMEGKWNRRRSIDIHRFGEHSDLLFYTWFLTGEGKMKRGKEEGETMFLTANPRDWMEQWMEVHSLSFEHGTSLAMIPWRHSFPFLCQSDHCTGVQHAVTEQMIEFEADPVHRPMKSSFRVEQWIPLRG